MFSCKNGNVEIDFMVYLALAILVLAGIAFGLHFCVKRSHQPASRASPWPTEDAADERSGVGLYDFVSYLPAHNYVFTPTREMSPAGSANSQIRPIHVLDSEGTQKYDEDGEPIKLPVSVWLDQNVTSNK